MALTRDGAVKVLDFGLAKGGATDSETNLTQSPTFTIGGTRDGVLLGTAPYMSPEQARGHVADRRADLWAFGCVLFEMLTGRMAFPGATTSDHIAAVLEREAEWAALPAGMPAAIHRLLRRCLEKDRMRRLDSAADARLDIDDALASPATERAMSRPLTLTHLAVAVVVGALMIAGTLAWRAADRGPMTPTYVSLDAPTDYVLGEDDFLAPLPTRTPMVFAPDGRSLIIQAAHAGKPQLFLRSLDRPDAKPIAGTDGARVPFVSPDGKWVGFLADNELRKVPIEGGTPTTICRLRVILGPNGAAWGARDVIVFGESVFGGGGRIMRVSAGGGTPVPVTAIPAPRRQHVAPFFLPDGTRFLFSDVSILDPADARLMVQSLDGGVARLLVASATDGRFLPTGRLAFMRLGTLMTAAFDLVRAEIVGDPVAALGGVMQSGLRLRAGANNTGAGMFAVSSLGALAAIRGPLIGGEENHLIWVTGDGRSSPAEPAAGIPAGGRLNARISPDRSRAIVTVLTPTRFEHWLADWTRDVWTLCSDCGGADSLASLIWSPDGRRLLFSRNETLVTHALDGSTAEQVIVREADRELSPTAWLTDGRIVYTSKSPSQPPEFEVKLMEAGGRAGRVVLPLGTGLQPDVSHDGHWLAYASAVGDQGNIVVQAFPGPGSRTTVSAGGGQDPVWSADGRTLYYLKGDRGGTAAFAIDITVAGDALTAGTPRELFRHPDSQTSTPRSHDVLDGPRFLLKDRSMSKRASVTRMDLVLNWTSTLPKGR